MLILIFAIAAGCIAAERFWPAMELPRVRAWWPRVLLINAIQLGITVLAGATWNRWFDRTSLFHLRDYLPAWTSALVVYTFSTFVFYWWHRYRHESQFFWRTLHQIHHSARRLEILTSFYKHPVEIWLNSIISSLMVYTLFGCDVQTAGYYTFLIAVGEFFYHWNIKTPRWIGYVFQRPESHRVHHQFRHHTNNFADLPIWDMLFGTFKNPAKFRGRCGYEAWREDRFDDMIVFRDLHLPAVANSAPLHFLPTCIGCSKRWACAAANAQPNPQESAKPLNGTGAQPKISDPNSTIRLEAEAGQKFAASRNFLNAFFVLEGALLVMIGQAPARLDAEERAAIGPKREIRNLR